MNSAVQQVEGHARPGPLARWPNDDDPVLLGFFLTRKDAWIALADLMEPDRRRWPKPVFSVVPVYSADPGNFWRVIGKPAAKICRMTGCTSFVGPEGFEGYCEDCADDVFGHPPVAEAITHR